MAARRAPLSHTQVWAALDALAQRSGQSPSGLAKLAGLDPTTFNPSKRSGSDGRARWPSTESLAKVLAATGASLEEFAALVNGAPARTAARLIPLIGLAQAGRDGFFDDGGFPAGAGWDEIAVPEVPDEHAYALAVSGDSMMPAYRAGDVLIVSPQAAIRRGDRVVAKTVRGEVMAKTLARQSGKTVELASLNPEFPARTLERRELAWMARILWVSQ